MMSRNWFCCISKTHAKLKAECSDPLEAGMRKVHDQLHLAQCVSLCRSIKSPSTETRSLPLLGPPWDLPVSAPPWALPWFHWAFPRPLVSWATVLCALHSGTANFRCVHAELQIQHDPFCRRRLGASLAYFMLEG